MKLSIIVPVYNVGQYVRHCLQSLLDQNLEDYEVLLINDASTDNSRGICSEWCEEHPTFRLINHERNIGLSAARNTGLQEAVGEYITFIDSDDFLAPDTYNTLLENMREEADVIEYPVRVHHLSKEAYTWQIPEGLYTFDEWMAKDGFMHCYAWNKIYRRRLWAGHHFPKGKYIEDMLTIPYVLQKAKVIQFSSQGLYYYCQRQGSILTTPSPQKMKDYLEAITALLQIPVSHPNYRLYLTAINAQLTYKQNGGKERLVPYHWIPLRVLLSGQLGAKGTLKALLHNLKTI